MATSRVDQVAEAAMKVQALRDQLATAEAELEAAKSAASTEVRDPLVAGPSGASGVRPVGQASDGDSSRRGRIRRLMEDGKQRSNAEIAEALGLPVGSVGDDTKRLESRSELQRVSPGVYVRPRKPGPARNSAKGTRPPRGRA